jgi:hypothetical protein
MHTATTTYTCTHLVTRIRLCGVLKIGVGAAGTVHADVACHCNVRTSMGLAHHGHHGNLERCDEGRVDIQSGD